MARGTPAKEDITLDGVLRTMQPKLTGEFKLKGEQVLGFNTRLHWIPKAGQEGFIVLNHNLQDFDKNASFRSAVADVSVKFKYTFRF